MGSVAAYDALVARLRGRKPPPKLREPPLDGVRPASRLERRRWTIAALAGSVAGYLLARWFDRRRDERERREDAQLETDRYWRRGGRAR